MVAQITEGSAYDRHGRPFKRRSYLPGIAVGLVLFVVTGVVWLIVLNRPVQTREAIACNPPPAPAEGPDEGTAPSLGQRVSHASMVDVPPAKLADTNIRVLNASGRGGQAAETAGALHDLGFAQPAAENDTIYTDVRLQCQGQIRFGPKGKATAVSLSLVAPCVELYEDERTGDIVDLALGTDFTSLVHTDDINAALAELGPGATTAAPDQSLVSRIHTEAC